MQDSITADGVHLGIADTSQNFQARIKLTDKEEDNEDDETSLEGFADVLTQVRLEHGDPPKVLANSTVNFPQ